jgi:hypothetical protein
MKRFLWTLFVAVVGFWFGWFAQGYPFNFGLLALLTAWGGCIGFGLGSIFHQQIATKRRVVIYWSLTTALVSLILFPLVPFRFVPLQVGAAFAIGALLGVSIGTVHLKLSQHKSQSISPSHVP